ncbi:MAG: hydroxysqualene dehydroxylase HpnE, partial [Planctomycetaceae bacterium]|nr:hydroxysqualene dehydroxylase HpnE [Planctomycetaceae bacterium]
MNREKAHSPAQPRQTTSPHKVVIFGGGLAGLAAAQALSSHGIAVELHEARLRLGGRASSFVDQTTGEVIDNCQHVAMGCCTNFFHFCEQADLSHQFQQLDSLLFIDEQGQQSRLQNGFWPAPFHLTGSFLRLKYFNWSERSEIIRGLRKLIRTTEYTRSFQDWLNEARQSSHVQRDFWQVVLVSALSESLDRIQYSTARQVFVQGFLSHRHAWKVSLPKVPLQELYGEQLLEHLRQQGVQIRLSSRLKEFRINVDQVNRAILANGEEVTADAYLLALPWHTLSRLFSNEATSPSFVKQAEQLESAPISSVHLWFDRPVTEEPHAVLLGRISQWIFNRSAIQQIETPERHYYQVVISQSRELAKWTQEKLVNQVLEEITALWPETSHARLVHSRVVREHQ